MRKKGICSSGESGVWFPICYIGDITRHLSVNAESRMFEYLILDYKERARLKIKS